MAHIFMYIVTIAKILFDKHICELVRVHELRKTPLVCFLNVKNMDFSNYILCISYLRRLTYVIPKKKQI